MSREHGRQHHDHQHDPRHVHWSSAPLRIMCSLTSGNMLRRHLAATAPAYLSDAPLRRRVTAALR